MMKRQKISDSKSQSISHKNSKSKNYSNSNSNSKNNNNAKSNGVRPSSSKNMNNNNLKSAKNSQQNVKTNNSNNKNSSKRNAEESAEEKNSSGEEDDEDEEGEEFADDVSVDSEFADEGFGDENDSDDESAESANESDEEEFGLNFDEPNDDDEDEKEEENENAEDAKEDEDSDEAGEDAAADADAGDDLDSIGDAEVADDSYVPAIPDLLAEHFGADREISPESILAANSSPSRLTKLPKFPDSREFFFQSGISGEFQSFNSLRNHLLKIKSSKSSKIKSLKDFHVPEAMIKQWRLLISKQIKKKLKSTAASAATDESDDSAPVCDDLPHAIHSSLFPLLSSYVDVWHSNVSLSQFQPVQQSIILHVLNHILRSNSLVSQHNQEIEAVQTLIDERAKQKQMRDRDIKQKKIQKFAMKHGKPVIPNHPQPASSAPVLGGSEELKPIDSTPLPPLPEYRDQGFTRCKVLVLVPVAHSAYHFVKSLLELLPPRRRDHILNKKRFLKEFRPEPEDRVNKMHSDEYKHLFDGKNNDAFRLGISFQSHSVKLYSDFFSADLIIASPLGLRMIVAAAGEIENSREADFLSSIEILILHQADVFSMQNWEHCELLMSAMNKFPHNPEKTDFSRVREWNLSGRANLYRQTIITSQHRNVDLNHFYMNYCKNIIGKIQYRNIILGGLNRIESSIKQLFQRIPINDNQSHGELSELRLKYFIQNYLPKLRILAQSEGHICIIIPNYFDFVRVRNEFSKLKLNFSTISEYSPNGYLSRARSNFYHGKSKILLITERFHYFRRYRIRGIHHLIFYSLPEYSDCYNEFVNSCELPSAANCIAFYTKFDSLQLERIVGTERAANLISSNKNTHMFC